MPKIYDDNDPEVVRAKAEAKARVMEARAKLHPLAQAIYALVDSAGDLIGQLIGQIGCLLIILIIVVALLAPQLFQLLLGGR